MLAIAVRYLTGRVVATDVGDRERPEWPPHPGRLFMALVAAWGAGGRREAEQRSLEWLERQTAPSLAFPDHIEAPALPTFVPVNDPKTLCPPEIRQRAERRFPSVVPVDDLVHFIWSAVEAPAELVEPLGNLCGRVTYLGHSRTLVHAFLTDSPPAPRLVPTAGRADHRLRVAAEGRLEQLEAEFRAGRWPSAGAWQGYSTPASQPEREAGGHFRGDIIVLKRVSGPRLGLGSTLKLCSILRDALMAVADQPVPEILSGHGVDGTPSVRPHLAVVPLGDVGHQHAEGSVLGLALLVPGLATDAERSAVALAASRVETLHLGRTGVWRLESVSPDDADRVALRAETWTRPARRWATVTPVVLDRFPKEEGDSEVIVAQALVRAGLPEPVDVITHAVSLHAGAPHAREFTAFESKTGARRWHCHSVVTFPMEVEGPVVAGAGRYRGYGFFCPLVSEEHS
jgi:CRISPR-associated protein Csb2